MNYRHIYCKIISYAKSQNRHKGDGNYYELHHILPKSLFPLWAKRKSNLVLLTAREHFFCHQLLEKIFPGGKMFLALWRLAIDGQNKCCSSREYERLKERYYMSDEHKKNSINATKESWKDPIKRSARIEKIKEARSKQVNMAWGKRSEESKKNISDGTKRAMQDPELREKLSNAAKEWCKNNKDKLREGGKKSAERTKLVAQKFKEYKANGGTLSWNEFQKNVNIIDVAK